MQPEAERRHASQAFLQHESPECPMFDFIRISMNKETD